jgi:hypothetical protein
MSQKGNAISPAPLLLSVGGRGRACGGWVAPYASAARTASPARTDAQRRKALNKCLPSPSPIALFEDSYLVANMNRSGDERRLANGENRFALINHHAPILWYLYEFARSELFRTSQIATVASRFDQRHQLVTHKPRFLAPGANKKRSLVRLKRLRVDQFRYTSLVLD